MESVAGQANGNETMCLLGSMVKPTPPYRLVTEIFGRCARVNYVSNLGISSPPKFKLGTTIGPQANRVNISCRDEAGEELVVPPGDLASETE
jgi:hypothetical protein